MPECYVRTMGASARMQQAARQKLSEISIPDIFPEKFRKSISNRRSVSEKFLRRIKSLSSWSCLARFFLILLAVYRGRKLKRNRCFLNQISKDVVLPF